MNKFIKRLLAGAMAFIALATAGISAVATNGFGLFAPEEQTAIQKPILSGGFEIKDEDVKGTAGMSLHVRKLLMSELDPGIMPTAEDAYQLTATVLPADAADKTVTYSVAWSNANSTWAKGKTVTDYVSVTQTSTGSLTATATCKQAFGEAIVVTVTSNDNSAAKATATLHYKQKVARYTAADADEVGMLSIYQMEAYTQYGSGTDILSANLVIDKENQDTVDCGLVCGITKSTVYTRSSSVSLATVEVTMSQTLLTQLQGVNSAIKGTISSTNGVIDWKELLSYEWFETYATTPAKENQIIDILCAFKDVAYTVKLTDTEGGSVTFSLKLQTTALSTQSRVESVSLNNVELEF